MSVPQTVHLVSPLPGLPGHDTFTLSPLDETGSVFTLESGGDEPLRFFVITPGLFFPAYAPEIGQEVRDRLALGEGDGAFLAIVTPPATKDATPTANLLAPLVLNPATGDGVQAILDGDEWPVRAPLG